MNQSLGNCCVIVAVIMTLLIVETTQQSVIIKENIKIRGTRETANLEIYRNSENSVCFGIDSQFAGWKMYQPTTNSSLRMFSVEIENNIYFMQINRYKVELVSGGPPTHESFLGDSRVFECKKINNTCYIKHVDTKKMLYASTSLNQNSCRKVKGKTTEPMLFEIRDN